jgi:acylphosphatase
MKLRIVVKGNVQAVGYRVIVKSAARSRDITGLVKNLDDGTVEIYCKGEDKAIKDFQKAINVRSASKSVFGIDVETIEVYSEGTKGFNGKKAPKRWATFDIDYGQKIDFANKEIIERQELFVMGGSQIHDDLEIIRTDLNTLDVKYGTISKSIASIDKNFAEMVKIFKKMNQ